MEVGVAMTHQNSDFPVLLRVPVVVSGQGGTEVDTSAGRLSKAKTQRRPTARERESERGGGFHLLFCCFCIFLSSRARIRHVEMKVLAKRGDG